MLTGTEIAVLLVMLSVCGVTVALVVMTLRDDGYGDMPGRSSQGASMRTPLGIHEQAAQFLVDLGQPVILEAIGERDRDQAEGQHQ